MKNLPLMVVVATGGAAAAATVTPVCTAKLAGIELRPTKGAPVDVNTGASPGMNEPAPAAANAEVTKAGGGPHQHPGGAFIHEVTTAVAAFEQGDTAVIVIVSVIVDVAGGAQSWALTMVVGISTVTVAGGAPGGVYAVVVWYDGCEE